MNVTVIFVLFIFHINKTTVATFKWVVSMDASVEVNILLRLKYRVKVVWFVISFQNISATVYTYIHVVTYAVLSIGATPPWKDSML